MPAYFDSPKNKALWARELDALRGERRSRTEEPDMAEGRADLSPGNPPVRERVSYEQLLEEERRERGVAGKRDMDGPSRGISGEMKREPALDREPAALGMRR